LAAALERWADVTVAFRRVFEPVTSHPFEILEIEPSKHELSAPIDDAAVRGIGYWEFLAYLRSLRRFAREQLPRYDIILEKSWLLSGYVSALCRQQGIPAVPIENIVPVLSGPLRSPLDLMRYARHWGAQQLAGRYLRQARLIIAETLNLKTAMTEQWRVPAERIEVVPLGVDRQRFRPLDQGKARGLLRIHSDATVLLYTGVLDRTHDLGPILESMAQMSGSSLQLHIVGDGALRERYEGMARALKETVFFHGRVSHQDVPQYIAAADLCLAPYDPKAFPRGEIAYSSLKIPEYLSAGRAVVSVPSGRILELVREGVSGFLFDNEIDDWLAFLRQCPDREQLRQMGEAAAASPCDSWEDTALAYHTICEREVLSGKEGGFPSKYAK
jgi:glycosyltransferase involved in cell wall biosynthesis